MTYQDNVRAAADALTRGEEANWELARLTYEATNGRGEGRHGVEGKVSLGTWAADVRARSGRRFSETTAGRYRRCWDRHGKNADGDVLTPFADAYAEVEGTPDRERMMQYEGTRLLDRGTPVQKVEQATQLLRDPEVQEAAADITTDLGATVFGVSTKQRRQTEEVGRRTEARSKERFANDPSVRAIDNARAVTDLTGVLSDYAREVARLLPQISALPDEDREAMGARLFLREAFTRAQGATEQVAALLKTGRVGGDVEDFVKSVLGGGDQGT